MSRVLINLWYQVMPAWLILTRKYYNVYNGDRERRCSLFLFLSAPLSTRCYMGCVARVKAFYFFKISFTYILMLNCLTFVRSVYKYAFRGRKINVSYAISRDLLSRRNRPLWPIVGSWNKSEIKYFIWNLERTIIFRVII